MIGLERAWERFVLFLVTLVARALVKRGRWRSIGRDPTIDNPLGEYLNRYAIRGWLPVDGRSKKYGHDVYLHNIKTPDYDPDLHNHPWRWALSIVLTVGYIEERYDVHGYRVRRTVKPWRPWAPWRGFNLIRHGDFHRISRLGYGDCGTTRFTLDGQLIATPELVPTDVWTLFITGRRVTSWGFLGANGFTDWRTRLRERGIEPSH